MPPPLKALNVGAVGAGDPGRLPRRRARGRAPAAAARSRAQDAARRARLGGDGAGGAARARARRRVAAGAPARSAALRRHRGGARHRRRALVGRSRRALAQAAALAARRRRRRACRRCCSSSRSASGATIACARRRSPSPAPPARWSQLIQAATDLDHDGYSSVLGGGDCNDFDRDVHPGALRLPRRRHRPGLQRPPGDRDGAAARAVRAGAAVGAEGPRTSSSSPSTRCAPITSAPTAIRARPRRASTRSPKSRSCSTTAGPTRRRRATRCRPSRPGAIPRPSRPTPGCTGRPRSCRKTAYSRRS